MKRSKFSLSHYRLLSMKMGELTPIGITEVLPGDTFQHSTSLLVRANALVAPVMHPVHARVHHWFVPHRILWTNWENFITAGPDGFNASVFPYIALSGTLAESTLADYLGIPTGTLATTVNVSALPFRAYALIWNEWYRDQDLQTALTISNADGADTTTSTALQNVAWEKDYFTTARPWTQKGPTVTIPLAGSAPVRGIMGDTGYTPNQSGATGHDSTGAQTYAHSITTAAAGGISVQTATGSTDSLLNVFADLTAVTASDINTLRQAFALQRYQEARARYGSRYTEYLRYLGVRSSDARLQRPEYLGGGKQTIQFSEVLQTGGTSTGAATGVGNLAGHGIGALRSNRYRRFFEEHGYVITVLSIKPRTIYQDGLPRHWSHVAKTDFWQKELQHIGQQAVLQQEVYMKDANPGNTFGYQDRYDEYRRMESGVSGNFRSTLNYWHMARIFASSPTLNASFVSANPTNRIFADQTGDDTIFVMASHSLQARRLIAKSGTSFIF